MVSVTRPLRITHIINDLRVGGAEVQLYELLRGGDTSRLNCRVIVLAPEAELTLPMRSLGIEVVHIDFGRGPPTPGAMLRLVRELRSGAPDIVQTWMYHSNLIGGLAWRLGTSRASLIWCIRQTNLDLRSVRKRTRIVALLCAALSRFWPSRTIFNAEVSRAAHAKLGYYSHINLTIPNGFDTDRFKPDDASREAVRTELNIEAGQAVIGLVARYDPQKDHLRFIHALRRAREQMPNIVAVLAGHDVTWENSTLSKVIHETGTENSIRLLGHRTDGPRLMNGLDLLVSSSLGEGFPNVLGEAMACGVPCVATNAGDSAFLVGDTGRIVPIGDTEAIAQGIVEMLSLTDARRDQQRQAARNRIIDNFSVPRMAGQYQDVYERLMAEDPRRQLPS